MTFEHKIKTKLKIRGFSSEKLLNNRGLISAVIDETILEINKKTRLDDDRKVSCFEIECTDLVKNILNKLYNDNKNRN